MPSWVGRLPSDVGYPAAGSLSADEYKAMALVYLPVIISPSLSLFISRNSRKSKGPRKPKGIKGKCFRLAHLRQHRTQTCKETRRRMIRSGTGLSDSGSLLAPPASAPSAPVDASLRDYDFMNMLTVLFIVAVYLGRVATGCSG